MLKSVDSKSDNWNVLRQHANMTMVIIADTQSDKFRALFV
jgi:hypothetical protein